MEIVTRRQLLLLTVILVSIFIQCTRIKALTIAVEETGGSGQWIFLEYNRDQIEKLKSCNDQTTSSDQCRIETNTTTDSTFGTSFVQIPKDNYSEPSNTSSDKIVVWSGYYRIFFGTPSTQWTKKDIEKANLCSSSENCQPLTLITWSDGNNVEMHVVWDNKQTARITQWDKDIINVINCCDVKDTTTSTATTSTVGAKTQSAKITSTTPGSTASSIKTTIEVRSTTGSTSMLSTNISPNAEENNDNETFSPLTIGLIIGLSVAVIIIILIVLVFVCKKRRKNNKRGYKNEHATGSTSTPIQNNTNNLQQTGLGPVREETSDTATPATQATASKPHTMLNPNTATSYTEIECGVSSNPAITSSLNSPESSNIVIQSHNEYEEPPHSSPYDHYSTIEPVSYTVYENSGLSKSLGHSHQTAAIPSNSTKINGVSSQRTQNSVAPEASKSFGNPAGVDLRMVINNERPSEPTVYSTLRQEVRNMKNPYDTIPTRPEQSNPSTINPMVPVFSAKQPPVTPSGHLSASNSSQNRSEAKFIEIVKCPPQSDPVTSKEVRLRHPEHLNDVYCNTTENKATKQINGVHYSLVLKNDKSKEGSVYFELENNENKEHPEYSIEEMNQTQKKAEDLNASNNDLLVNGSLSSNEPSNQQAIATPDASNIDHTDHGDKTDKGKENKEPISGEQEYLNLKEVPNVTKKEYYNVSLRGKDEVTQP